MNHVKKNLRKMKMIIRNYNNKTIIYHKKINKQNKKDYNKFMSNFAMKKFLKFQIKCKNKLISSLNKLNK